MNNETYKFCIADHRLQTTFNKLFSNKSVLKLDFFLKKQTKKHVIKTGTVYSFTVCVIRQTFTVNTWKCSSQIQ